MKRGGGRKGEFDKGMMKESSRLKREDIFRGGKWRGKRAKERIKGMR